MGRERIVRECRPSPLFRLEEFDNFRRQLAAVMEPLGRHRADSRERTLGDQDRPKEHSADSET